MPGIVRGSDRKGTHRSRKLSEIIRVTSGPSPDCCSLAEDQSSASLGNRKVRAVS